MPLLLTYVLRVLILKKICLVCGKVTGLSYKGETGKERIKIIKIDEKRVHLTGYTEGGTYPDTEEVYGRIENSTLLLTWQAAVYTGCKGRIYHEKRRL